MADDIVLNAGTGGATLATDDIGGKHYQYVKMVWGSDDTANKVDTSAPLPTNLRTSGGAEIGTTGTPLVVGQAAAGSLGKAENAAAGAGDVGVPAYAIRDDALTALGVAEGDYTQLRVSSTGQLHVTGGGGGTQYNVDGVAGAADTGTLALVVRDDALTTLGVADGDYTQLRVSSTGQLHVTGAGGGTQYNVDDAEGATDTGTLSLAVRDDALSALGVAEGDYVGLKVNSTGALHVTGAGGGTQYNVNDAEGATDTGTMALAVRDDSLSALGVAEGDYVGLKVNSTGALHVTGGGGGTEYTQDDAHADPATASTLLIPRDDALATQESLDGDWTLPRANARGALWIELDTTNGLTPGTLAANLGKQIDSPSTGSDVGVAALSVRDDVLSSLTPGEGDFVHLRSDVQGALWTKSSDTADIKTAIEATGVSSQNIQGAIAHDAAVSTANPVLLGAEARTTTPTAVADGDVVRLQADDQGRLVVVPNAPRDGVTMGRVVLTTTTRTQLIAAGGAGVFRDLTLLTLSNESGTEVRADIYDLSTGGTPIFSVDMAADGGGAVIPMPVPVPQATAANAWDIELSAAVSSVYASAQTVDRV